ncbi:hypothetical protein ACLOJK_008258 [Asimina triloba]
MSCMCFIGNDRDAMGMAELGNLTHIVANSMIAAGSVPSDFMSRIAVCNCEDVIPPAMSHFSPRHGSLVPRSRCCQSRNRSTTPLSAYLEAFKACSFTRKKPNGCDICMADRTLRASLSRSALTVVYDPSLSLDLSPAAADATAYKDKLCLPFPSLFPVPEAKHLSAEPWQRLDGKVVMVTGASSCLGREFCLDLANAGCTIVAAARRTDRLNSL